MILMIDNYDSFTYNIVQYFYDLNQDVLVCQNDQTTLNEIHTLKPKYIVIGPGPCTPDTAGISLAVIEKFAGQIPILGICLGHQAIGQAFGGEIIRAKTIMHGRVSKICHQQQGVFQNLPNHFLATRYHSLLINPRHFPDDLQITAWTRSDTVSDELEIMAIRHRTLAIEGVQFHPESILSEHGHQLLKNFLTMYQSF